MIHRLACAPVSYGPSGVDGSVSRRAQCCGQEVWVSPSGQRMVDDGAEIWCPGCVPMDAVGRLVMPPGGAAEIDRALGPGAGARADQILAAANEKLARRKGRD